MLERLLGVAFVANKLSIESRHLQETNGHSLQGLASIACVKGIMTFRVGQVAVHEAKIDKVQHPLLRPM